MDLGVPSHYDGSQHVTERVKLMRPPKSQASRDDSPTRRAKMAVKSTEEPNQSLHSAQAERIGTVFQKAHQALTMGNVEESQNILVEEEDELVEKA